MKRTDLRRALGGSARDLLGVFRTARRRRDDEGLIAALDARLEQSVARLESDIGPGARLDVVA